MRPIAETDSLHVQGSNLWNGFLTSNNTEEHSEAREALIQPGRGPIATSWGKSVTSKMQGLLPNWHF